MYNATQDLILTVKKKTISIVPQLNQTLFGLILVVLKFIIFSQFKVMALMFGIAFSRILQKKKQ